MSPSAWRGVKLAVVLFAAALLQCAYADSWSVWGARPDFLLTTTLVGAMFCSESGAAALGFFGGLLHAALAAPPHAGFGSVIVSRTLVCFAVGWLEEQMFRDSLVVALAVAFVGSAAAECLFFLFYPQHNVLHWARLLLLTSLYNTLLAAPIYFAIRRFLGRHRTREPI
jgi:hypothetical protein